MLRADDVEREILSLIAAAIPDRGRRRPSLSRETHLRRDLGLDSLRLVALVVRFEERLHVDLANAGDIEFSRIQTVGEVIDIGQRIVARSQDSRGHQRS
jgi:acyl carrier protein